MDSITLKEVIDKMDTGATFSIGWRTYDKQKSAGGEWIFIDKAMKYRYITEAEKKAAAQKGAARVQLLKNPNHYENSTRNIVVMANGRLIKVHLRLIRLFNNKTVL